MSYLRPSDFEALFVTGVTTVNLSVSPLVATLLLLFIVCLTSKGKWVVNRVA